MNLESVNTNEFGKSLAENIILLDLKGCQTPKDVRRVIAKNLVLAEICDSREEAEILGVDVRKCLSEGTLKYRAGIGFYLPDIEMEK